MNDKTTTLAELKQLVEGFVAQREWQPFHDPKNLSCSIAIEAAELMEHFQWFRSDQLHEIKQDSQKMVEVQEELADILAYVVSFASTMEIDLAAALEDKMRKNETKYPADRFRGRFS